MNRLLGWVLLVILVAACAAPNPAVSPLASPINANSLNSPIDPAAALPLGPAFTLNDPIQEGDTTIAGTGGPNVPIKIIDISLSGVDIAAGLVGKDGKFSIPVTGQLLKGHNIGIILGDLAGTNFKRDDFVKGPNYNDLPYIGILFASTHVQ